MKKYALFIYCANVFASVPEIPASAQLIDGTKAIIYSPEETVVITHADIRKHDVTGRPIVLDDLITQWLIYLDAQQLKMTPQDEAIDRYVAAIQKENNLTDKQFEAMLINSGYTLDQFKESLKRMQVAQGMMEFKTRSNSIVPYEMVEEYYAAHPLQSPKKYQLQTAIVPFKGDVEKQLRQLQKSTYRLDWQTPFWISEDEIADTKTFIKGMTPGTVEIKKEPTSFIAYKMIQIDEPRLLSIDERYDEIVELLASKKQEASNTAYIDELYQKNVVIRF